MTLGKMKRIVWRQRSIVMSRALLMGLAAQFLAPAAFAQTKPAVELEGVIAREQVDGDLKTAIAAYQKIAADTSASREVRAKSLLHLAGCYEKLGRQAQGVYRQIVREFGEQPAAAQARMRLASLRRAAQASVSVAMTQRLIEPIPGANFGSSDTDGRQVVYRNRATGDLIYSDLAAKTSRVIFKSKMGDAPSWVPSRDFSMVALHFRTLLNRPGFFAVIKIDGTGYRELMREEEPGSPFEWPSDPLNWSWDNRYLLVLNRDRLLTVSVANGDRRELVRVKGGWPVSWSAFSPDGRFVAYEILPVPATLTPLPGAGDASLSRIFIVPVKGGEPRLLYEEPAPETQNLRLLDWTANGRYLAIGSGRTGRDALHLIPVRDGQAAGSPVFVRYGNVDSGFTAKNGKLVCGAFKPGGLWAVHFTSLDQNRRPGVWQRLNLHGDNNNLLSPLTYWSPDGNQFVYKTTDGRGGGVVRIFNLLAGEDRDIYHSPAKISCVWATRQPKLFCIETKDKPEMLSIVPASGAVERLGMVAANWIRRASQDDRALYAIRTDTARSATVRLEIATRQETTLQEDPLTAMVAPSLVSLDERWLIRRMRQHIEVRPVSGGDWKSLVTVNSPPFLESGGRVSHLAVTPDGNWLLYHDIDSDGKQGLFQVQMTGGSPERLGDFPMRSTCCGMEISADGRKLIVTSYDPSGYELWTLENYAPVAPKL